MAKLLQAMLCLWWDMDHGPSWFYMDLHSPVCSAVLAFISKLPTMPQYQLYAIVWRWSFWSDGTHVWAASNPESWGSNWNISQGNHGTSLIKLFAISCLQASPSFPLCSSLNGDHAVTHVQSSIFHSCPSWWTRYEFWLGSKIWFIFRLVSVSGKSNSFHIGKGGPSQCSSGHSPRKFRK